MPHAIKVFREMTQTVNTRSAGAGDFMPNDCPVATKILLHCKLKIGERGSRKRRGVGWSGVDLTSKSETLKHTKKK